MHRERALSGMGPPRRIGNRLQITPVDSLTLLDAVKEGGNYVTSKSKRKGKQKKQKKNPFGTKERKTLTKGAKVVSGLQKQGQKTWGGW